MAARVVGIRQEGVNPCRMVPSMKDEVHGSYMTSRAKSNVRGNSHTHTAGIIHRLSHSYNSHHTFQYIIIN